MQNMGFKQKNNLKRSDFAGDLICQKIINFSFYLLIFLLPLFFLPFTSEILDFNKQTFLFVITIISLLAWLAKIVITKELNFKKSFLNLPVLLFLAVYFFASLFSNSKYQSFIGSQGNEKFSFITILCFVLLYFIIINNIKEKEVKNLISLLLLSSFLSALYGLTQTFGRYLLPWEFTKNKSFNALGTFNSLAVFIGFALSLSTLYFLSLKENPKKTKKILLFLVWLFLFSATLMIDSSLIWICLIASMLFALIISFLRPYELNKIEWLALPMLILVVSVFFLLLKSPINLSLPGEISPSTQASLEIAKKTIQEQPLLGSGPGTFNLDYSKYRSPSVNQTIFWNVRFNQAGSYIITAAASLGILGLISWFLLIAIFIYLGITKLIRKNQNQMLGLTLFSGWLFLTLAKFLYSSNLVLEFLPWLLMALFLTLQEEKNHLLSLKKEQRTNLLFSFFFLVFIVISLTAFYLVGQRYVAEVYYKKALVFNRQNKIEETIKNLAKAIQLNKYQDLYYRGLTQAFLAQIDQEIINPSKDSSRKIQLLTTLSINSAKKTTDLSPLNVSNWSTRASVYQKITPYSQGAEQWAINFFNKAIELEPNNPHLYTELGKTYLMAGLLMENKTQDKNAQQINKKQAQDNLEKAKNQFGKALELKKDYAPAQYQLALIYVKEKKIKEAIGQMETAQKYNPRDIGTALQLGLLYYQNNQKDKTEAQFKRVLALSPKHLNAHWLLSALYEKQGKIKEAISELEIIAKLNPDNKVISERLAQLKAGKTTSKILPEPLKEPITEIGE